jgi:hypothetical protein
MLRPLIGGRQTCDPPAADDTGDVERSMHYGLLCQGQVVALCILDEVERASADRVVHAVRCCIVTGYARNLAQRPCAAVR